MKPLLLIISLLWAILPGKAQTTRVLFIGNSYTGANNLPEMTRQLALSLGDTLVVQSSTPGGFTFQGHTTNATTQTLIAQGNWDHVVLQEQSQVPSFPPAQVAVDCLPYAAALVDAIRGPSPCAETVFYMTWGRENGDAQNCATWPPVCSYDGMQQRLRDSYLQMAMDNSAECAPVGVAWKRVREEYPGIQLYATDGSHPSVAGTYLVACTMYSTFFRRSSAGASFNSSLDASTAATLQAMASAVVLDSMAVWNIGINWPVAQPDHSVLNGGEVAFSENSINTTNHFWNLGDGTTSTASSFTHTYSDNGTFEVNYQATDSCGRTSTSTFIVEVFSTTIGEHLSIPFRVIGGPEQMLIRNEAGEGILTLFDERGRVLRELELGVRAEKQIPWPAERVIVWRFVTHKGLRASGTCVRP
ncbi:MAG: PKD domain-containing protein [Flavobacteriales bacterium]